MEWKVLLFITPPGRAGRKKTNDTLGVSFTAFFSSSTFYLIMYIQGLTFTYTQSTLVAQIWGYSPLLSFTRAQSTYNGHKGNKINFNLVLFEWFKDPFQSSACKVFQLNSFRLAGWAAGEFVRYPSKSRRLAEWSLINAWKLHWTNGKSFRHAKRWLMPIWVMREEWDYPVSFMLIEIVLEDVRAICINELNFRKYRS